MATEDMDTEIEDLNLEPETRMEQILNGETLEPEDRTEYFVQKALGRFGPKPPTPTPSDEIFVVKAEVTAWDDSYFKYPTDFDIKTSAHEIFNALGEGKQIVLEFTDAEVDETFHRMFDSGDRAEDNRLLVFYVRYDDSITYGIMFRVNENAISDKRLYQVRPAQWAEVTYKITSGNNCTLNMTWERFNALMQYEYVFIYINNGSHYMDGIVTGFVYEDHKLVAYAIGAGKNSELPYTIKLRQVGDANSNEATIEFLYAPSLPSHTAADAGKVLGIDENGNLAWVEK